MAQPCLVTRHPRPAHSGISGCCEWSWGHHPSLRGCLGLVQCTKCLLCLGWRERKGEQNTGTRGTTCPSHRSCQPGMCAVMVPLTLGQPEENWAPRTLLTLPRTHQLAAACDRSPGPSAESPWSGKRQRIQKHLKLRAFISLSEALMGAIFRGLKRQEHADQKPHCSWSESNRTPMGCFSALCRHASRGLSLHLGHDTGRPPPISLSLISIFMLCSLREAKLQPLAECSGLHKSPVSQHPSIPVSQHQGPLQGLLHAKAVVQARPLARLSRAPANRGHGRQHGNTAACHLPCMLISVPHLISGALCSGNISWKCFSACMTADVHST